MEHRILCHERSLGAVTCAARLSQCRGKIVGNYLRGSDRQGSHQAHSLTPIEARWIQAAR